MGGTLVGSAWSVAPFVSFTLTVLRNIFSPKVSVVVVTKKINTRFFARSGNRLNNPPAGTVVDTEVTKPEL